ENEGIPMGLTFTAQPAVSADRRFVYLKFDCSWTELAQKTVPLSPVTALIERKNANGSVDRVPFTQYLQQPQVKRFKLDKSFTVADGATAVFSGMRTEREVCTECGLPVLAKLP